MNDSATNPNGTPEQPTPAALAPVSGSAAPETEKDVCWCGVENPYYAPLPSRCDGYGTLQCYCGGDFCVCHWHGETECFGCPDCQGDEMDED